MARHTIRKGDTVVYSGPNLDGRLNRAVCQGHGWHKGRRVVHLDNGHWCYRDDVRAVQRSKAVRVVPQAGEPPGELSWKRSVRARDRQRQEYTYPDVRRGRPPRSGPRDEA